jgi:hypothetical protein
MHRYLNPKLVCRQSNLVTNAVQSSTAAAETSDRGFAVVVQHVSAALPGTRCSCFQGLVASVKVVATLARKPLLRLDAPLHHAV